MCVWVYLVQFEKQMTKYQQRKLSSLQRNKLIQEYIYFSSSTLFKFTANFTEVYLLIFRKKSEVIYWSLGILYKIRFNTSVLYLAICIIYRICSGYQFLRKHGFYQNLAYMCQGLFSTDVQLLVPLLFRFKRVHSIL